MRLQLVPGSIITSTLKAFASGRTKYIKHIFFCFTTILLLGDSFHFLLLSPSSQDGPSLAAFGVHVKFLSVLTTNCKMADSATGFFLFCFQGFVLTAPGLAGGSEKNFPVTRPKTIILKVSLTTWGRKLKMTYFDKVIGLVLQRFHCFMEVFMGFINNMQRSVEQ